MPYAFKENIIFSKYFYYSLSGQKFFNREHHVHFIKPKDQSFQGASSNALDYTVEKRDTLQQSQNSSS